MTIDTYTPGWSQDEGPLHTLITLGLARPEASPRWLKWPKTYTNEDGATYWRSSLRYVFKDAICSLAALSFEGYHVSIHPGGPHELSIEIKTAKDTTP